MTAELSSITTVAAIGFITPATARVTAMALYAQASHTFQSTVLRTWRTKFTRVGIAMTSSRSRTTSALSASVRLGDPMRMLTSATRSAPIESWSPTIATRCPRACTPRTALAFLPGTTPASTVDAPMESARWRATGYMSRDIISVSTPIDSSSSIARAASSLKASATLMTPRSLPFQDTTTGLPPDSAAEARCGSRTSPKSFGRQTRAVTRRTFSSSVRSGDAGSSCRSRRTTSL